MILVLLGCLRLGADQNGDIWSSMRARTDILGSLFSMIADDYPKPRKRKESPAIMKRRSEFVRQDNDAAA